MTKKVFVPLHCPHCGHDWKMSKEELEAVRVIHRGEKRRVAEYAPACPNCTVKSVHEVTWGEPR